MAEMAGLEPLALANEFLKDLGVDPLATGYSPFKLRDKATSKEVTVVVKKRALDLHPDKCKVDEWLA